MNSLKDLNLFKSTMGFFWGRGGVKLFYAEEEG